MSIVLLTSCGTAGGGSGEDAASGPTRTVEHDMGEAEVPAQPQRIVALELPYIDMLSALRVSPVGLVDDGDPETLIPEVRERIGEWESVGSRSEPNLEQIAKLEPDLIIADNERHAAIYEELNEIAPTVVFTARYAGYEKTLDVAREVGNAINKSDEMNAEIGRLEGRLDELSRTNSDGDNSENGDRDSLAVIPRERGTAQVLGEGSYVADILDRVRVPYAPEAAAYPAEADSASTGLEGLAEIDPAVLFVMTDAETTMDHWQSSEVWQKLTAVENEDVHAVSRAQWTRSRGLVAMELIAEEAVELFDER
ncbi:ABC transporter substrate-binding protein [Saccharomonospora sp. CUA-673]|uniref:ABC transporter substrate-binding protein n=1 Tax=Saccharomonospora sp. CUA-673 TaxID=1904969 RepID=UPI00130139F7|nr:ABC transporter substrate-binding protein [Saccharomonospora sp. CUA-673]